MRPRFVCTLLSPLLVLLAGCIHGDVAKVVPVSGGKTILVQLTREGLKAGEADGYRVSGATLTPGKESRTAVYNFGLKALHEPALRRIRIVDISDEKAAPLIDDQNPTFHNSEWVAQTDPISADDPRMQWVFQIPTSMRVYEFTLTESNGREVTFNHIVVYPPPLKAIMRSGWGERY